MNDGMGEMHLQHIQETISSNISDTLVVSFTICRARLKSYKALEVLGDRVLHFEIDSVIYVDNDDLPSLPLGDYFGQCRDEADAGDCIEEFMSGGPKHLPTRPTRVKWSTKCADSV